MRQLVLDRLKSMMTGQDGEFVLTYKDQDVTFYDIEEMDDKDVLDAYSSLIMVGIHPDC